MIPIFGIDNILDKQVRIGFPLDTVKNAQFSTTCTENAVFAHFLAIGEHAIAKYTFRLRIGGRLCLTAKFADTLDRSHLRPRRWVWLKELLRLHLQLLHKLVRDVCFLYMTCLHMKPSLVNSLRWERQGILYEALKLHSRCIWNGLSI